MKLHSFGRTHSHTYFSMLIHAYLWALLGKVSCFSDKNFERKKDTQKHDNILHQHSIQKIVLGQEKMGKCLCFVSLNSPFRFLPCFSQIGSPPPPNTTCTHNYVVCLKIWSLLRLYSTVKIIGCKSCGELFLLVLNSVRPKPLFWFRSNTETKTQIDLYFQPIL